MRKKGDEIKTEFTLNLTSVGGLNFYNVLKANKTIEIQMDYMQTYFCLQGTSNFLFDPGYLSSYQKGDLSGRSYTFTIFTGSPVSEVTNEKIGKIIKPEELDTILASCRNNDKYFFEFLLVEEKNKTPKKKKKSGGWETLKILKRVQALKRYRIVKRLKTLKALKN